MSEPTGEKSGLDQHPGPYWIIETSPDGPLALMELDRGRWALPVYTRGPDEAMMAESEAVAVDVSASQLAEILWFGTEFFGVHCYCIDGYPEQVFPSQPFIESHDFHPKFR